jgi:hypothetical protein
MLQHPHEAFGMVFNFDGVVADLPNIKREAWVALAQQLELPLQQQMLHHPELQVCGQELTAGLGVATLHQGGASSMWAFGRSRLMVLLFMFRNPCLD